MCSRETVLGTAEMVTAVEAPLQPLRAGAYHEADGEGKAFDFALVSVAVVLAMQTASVAMPHRLRLGLLPGSLRAPFAEAVLKGRNVVDEAAAARARLSRRQKPLSNNGYKAKRRRAFSNRPSRPSRRYGTGGRVRHGHSRWIVHKS